MAHPACSHPLRTQGCAHCVKSYHALYCHSVSLIAGDLFASPFCLAHCISADAHMRKGVAAVFRHLYGGIQDRMSPEMSVGDVVIQEIDNGHRYAYHMITKKHFWEKPTLQAVKLCLQKLVVIMEANNVQYVSLPWIGTGLDRLARGDVWKIINEVFRNTALKAIIHQRDGW